MLLCTFVAWAYPTINAYGLGEAIVVRSTGLIWMMAHGWIGVAVIGVRLHLRELLGGTGLQQRRLLGALGALAFRAHLLGRVGGDEEGQGQDSGASHVDLRLDRGAGVSLAILLAFDLRRSNCNGYGLNCRHLGPP